MMTIKYFGSKNNFNKNSNNNDQNNFLKSDNEKKKKYFKTVWMIMFHLDIL